MQAKQYKEFIHHFPDSAQIRENKLKNVLLSYFTAWHLKLAL